MLAVSGYPTISWYAHLTHACCTRAPLSVGLSPMERFMTMDSDQLQAAQMLSMAADELEALIPTITDVTDTEQGEAHHCVCLLSVCLWITL